MKQLIPHQLEFRQELPEIIGNLDYRIFRDQLERISEIIDLGLLDFTLIEYLLRKIEKDREKEFKKLGKSPKPMSRKEMLHVHKMAKEALRCTIARNLINEPYRVFSAHLADSVLLQKFCLLDNFGGAVKVPSKSTLQRYEQIVPENVIRKIVRQLNEKANERSVPDEHQILHLQNPISLENYYADLTVIKTNIHFPVDWVLLIDAVRTLSKCIIWIRKSGIKNRMQDPAAFMKTMNRLSMQMTHTRRRKDSKKEQKRILRLMKKITKIIEKHAKRHRDLLKEKWEEAELKAGHVKQVILRIEGILTKLPHAIKQAHERIIGERAIKNKDKLLSLYEPETKVIIRGKAGAEVEFGNKAFISEQANGLITDWKLYNNAPSDNACIIESLDRLKKDNIKPKQVTGDRGTFSKKNSKILIKRGIENNLCPRDINHMRSRFRDIDFARHQIRRGQTEGRIGIIKNCFLGTPFRNKGFASRESGVTWRILTHNLWVLARLPRAETEKTFLPLVA